MVAEEIGALFGVASGNNKMRFLAATKAIGNAEAVELFSNTICVPHVGLVLLCVGLALKDVFTVEAISP